MPWPRDRFPKSCPGRERSWRRRDSTPHAGWHTLVLLQCCSYMIQALDKFAKVNGQTIRDNSFVCLGTDLGPNHVGDSAFYAISKTGGKFRPCVYDATAALLDFLSSCNAAIGRTSTIAVKGGSSGESVVRGEGHLRFFELRLEKNLVGYRGRSC